MDLDARQTRGLFLAGAVAIPSPFPSTGTIALDVGRFNASPGADSKDKECFREKDVVIVYEFCVDRAIRRLMLQDDVSAIFISGKRDDTGIFRISRERRVDDLEKGEWFLDTDINPEAIRNRFRLEAGDDISTSNSILRGIVFVAENVRMIRTTDVFQTAGDDVEVAEAACCTSCRPSPNY